MNYEDMNENTAGNVGVDAAAFTDYDQMKEKLTMEVVSADRNAEMLAAVPHEKMEDIAIVYKLVIEDADDHRDTILVTNDMLKEPFALCLAGILLTGKLFLLPTEGTRASIPLPMS